MTGPAQCFIIGALLGLLAVWWVNRRDPFNEQRPTIDGEIRAAERRERHKQEKHP
jgi:hypothetical protein